MQEYNISDFYITQLTFIVLIVFLVMGNRFI